MYFKTRHFLIDSFITEPILAEWNVQRISKAGSVQVLALPQQPNRMTKKRPILSHTAIRPKIPQRLCVFVHWQDKFSFATTGAPATCSQQCVVELARAAQTVCKWVGAHTVYPDGEGLLLCIECEHDEPIRPVYFQLIAASACRSPRYAACTTARRCGSAFQSRRASLRFRWLKPRRRPIYCDCRR